MVPLLSHKEYFPIINLSCYISLRDIIRFQNQPALHCSAFTDLPKEQKAEFLCYFLAKLIRQFLVSLKLEFTASDSTIKYL